MENIIKYTNERLVNWYKNAELDFNVIGEGFLTIENDKAIINYTENGVKKTWSMYFVEEYISIGLDYIFNVWSEEAE